jgi:hypothetical protein
MLAFVTAQPLKVRERAGPVAAGAGHSHGLRMTLLVLL